MVNNVATILSKNGSHFLEKRQKYLNRKMKKWDSQDDIHNYRLHTRQWPTIVQSVNQMVLLTKRPGNLDPHCITFFSQSFQFGELLASINFRPYGKMSFCRFSFGVQT